MKIAWLIDDDEEMTTAIALMLKLLEIKSRSFLSAPEAAQLLINGEKPDFIILDINMPAVSGKDFLEFVRMRADEKALPIVMLSSEFSNRQRHDLMDMGANAFLTKPVTIDELDAAIKQVIR